MNSYLISFGAALLSILFSGATAFAQNESIIVEAEAGVVGAQFSILSDGPTQYAAIQSTVGGFNPTTDARVITLTVTFPSAGVYELYARLRVGPATFTDDSFYYANGFGVKNPASDADWILANNLANPVGFTLPSDKVVGGGLAQSNVWKWVKLSAFDGGEPPVAGFNVDASSLTHTFQVAGREDGLDLDKFAFGRQGVYFTVFDLDNGLPGTTVPPPPPYVPPGPPIATGLPKFLGSVHSPSQVINFTAYWNQVTPENAGKWGSVEGTRDVMNWGGLDAAYSLATTNGYPFRMHTLIWGNQQPAWIETLPAAEQLEEIKEWFAAVAERYPGIDFIDVVNEPLHDPPDGPGDGQYIEALGGAGASGWEWVIESFRLARQYFPNAKLGINEFSITNNTADMQRYIEIIHLLQADGLIDTVGVQGHAFSTRVPAATTIANLNLLATTLLPIYVTELDIDGPTDEVQLADYQRIFPAFWEHPAVRGITLWGYRPGHWRTAQGAYIVHENGAERPAMVWLRDYVANTPLRPWFTSQPASQTATVTDTVTFSVAADGSAPLLYEWRKDGAPIEDNASATTPTLILTNLTTADAGSYTCVVSNAAGNATSDAATLVVNKGVAIVTLGTLAFLYDGTPKSVVAATSPGGLTLNITYNGSSAPPIAPGSYSVIATVDDANYVGFAAGTLTISTHALVRHAPTINGLLDGSIQVLLPESAALNSSANISGDWLVPGTPTVRVNGTPSFGGTLDGTGSASPSAHTITINAGARLRHVVRRTDAVTFPTISVPSGTPDLILNGNSRQVLGEQGATVATVYNFRNVIINSRATLDVVGPVIVNVEKSATINGVAGNAAHPEWLILNAGTITVNRMLAGRVASDRLIINGSGALRGGR